MFRICDRSEEEEEACKPRCTEHLFNITYGKFRKKERNPSTFIELNEIDGRMTLKRGRKHW